MSEFVYTLYSVDSDSTPIPCETIKDTLENRETFYLDSLSLDKSKNASQKYYKFRINQKKRTENGGKLLIHFKFEFYAENYRENELATINQWKMWHESSALQAFSKELQFVRFEPSTGTVQNMSDANTLPNYRTFLWDFSASKLEENFCEFDVHFGCHSTQFPIKLGSKYIGSLFSFSVDIYSVVSKRKLAIIPITLKISRFNSSQFKLDSCFFQELTEETVAKKSLIEQNLDDLLASLNVKNNSEPQLPSYEKFKEVKFDQSFFAYRINASTTVSDSIPVVYLWRERQFTFEIENFYFNTFYGENELIKTVISLKFAPTSVLVRNRYYEQTTDIIIWKEKWERSNVGKSLLNYVLHKDCQVEDTVLFDAYSNGVDQLCLIWLPSATNGKLSVRININDNQELTNQKNYDATINVESFLISNNEKVDEAQCKVNFVDTTSTVKYVAELKSAASYLIGLVLYISVDGDEYKLLTFPQSFLDTPNENAFKAKLVALIQKIKNMDTFEIQKLTYFESAKSTSGTSNLTSIYRSLKPKSILKCILRKVAVKEKPETPAMPQYEVDLIDQKENYLKAYI